MEAQVYNQTGYPDLKQFIEVYLIDLINVAVPVIAGLALLVFFWGLTKFILKSAGDEKAIQEGKDLMKWGVIALFVMVSLWGIIRFVYYDFGFSDFGIPQLPTTQ